MTGRALSCTGLRWRLYSQGRKESDRRDPPSVLSAVWNLGHVDRLCDTNVFPEVFGTHIKRKFYEINGRGGHGQIATPTRLRSEPVCGAVVCA